MKPKFFCSYRGETDYRIGSDTYSVRNFAADDGHYNQFREVEAAVGTLMRGHGITEFPPDAVAALFPGYTPARYDPASNSIQVKSPVRIVRVGNTVYHYPYWRERERILLGMDRTNTYPWSAYNLDLIDQIVYRTTFASNGDDGTLTPFCRADEWPERRISLNWSRDIAAAIDDEYTQIAKQPPTEPPVVYSLANIVPLDPWPATDHDHSSFAGSGAVAGP